MLGWKLLQKSIEWFRDGMFEVAYRINIYPVHGRNRSPTADCQLHPEWDDKPDYPDGFPGNANRKFSSHPRSGMTSFSWARSSNTLAERLFLGPNEMMSWTSMLTEALPIPRRFDVDAEGKRVLDAVPQASGIADDTYRVLRPDENSADVVTGEEWGMFNTDSSSFAGSFMSMMGSYAVISSIMEFTSEGEVDPMMYSPVSQNPNSPLGFGYNAGFLSPAVPGLTGRGGREVRIDLINQADTAFRLLDPQGFFMSRLSVGNRFIDNQMKSGTFLGEPLDTPWRKMFQGITDLGPMFVEAGLQEARHWNGWLEDEIPAGETRLGRVAQASQSLTGLEPPGRNESATDQPLDSGLGGQGLHGLGTLAAAAGSAIRQQATGGEFDRTAETSARRRTPWGPLTFRNNVLAKL